MICLRNALTQRVRAKPCKGVTNKLFGDRYAETDLYKRRNICEKPQKEKGQTLIQSVRPNQREECETKESKKWYLSFAFYCMPFAILVNTFSQKKPPTRRQTAYRHIVLNLRQQFVMARMRTKSISIASALMASYKA